ncbi:hypothetical protein [Streptomyces sp. MW-W600-10]|uniref:hypothetical protein n=1 Tax=Streptomyces sp. MW-W600-10 TaxID=2829819 RepID=UPI001C4609DE|nr:hypothetical protein [Streptomyces sp. MW-W600-10]MBV7245981.1 hypothetical protein [Streptomyces sp. MW-W600-10]
MALLRFNGVFDIIELQVTQSQRDGEGFEVPADHGAVRLSLQEARDALYGRGRDESVGAAIWGQAVSRARACEAPEGPKQLLLIWLALPGLRGTVHRASRNLRVDRKELEAEALLAILEALAVVDAEAPGLGRSLVGTACNRVWALARRMATEMPVADVAQFIRFRAAFPPHEPEAELVPRESDWELGIAPPDRPDGLAASIRFTVRPARVQDEWLGDLAVRIGLRDVVHRARRPGGGARIGTLSLRAAGDGR